MKHSQKENARVKDQIVAGLFSELTERPFSEITVSQLIKAAGVARASYYRNFESKEEILDYYLGQLVEQHRQDTEATGTPVGWTSDTVRFHITQSFALFKREKDRFTLLLDNGLSSYILDFLKNMAQDPQRQQRMALRNHYEQSFFMGATFNVLMDWLQNGAVESPEEMTDIILRYTPADLFR
ncbi:TetR/AcrR family transcriptional regulator [Leuconostocaceae bacterium ESL0723]|nr:TetR/AcrR family transcriptional regulator [Leuconostocaceae bacterium ESL0723]